MFKDVISVFNGKNMKVIPVFKSNADSKKLKTSNSLDKVDSEKKNRVIFPQYLTDVLVELKNIRYSLDDELSIYKRGDIGEIISQITCSQLPAGWWTIERIKEDALKYNGRFEWEKSSPSACNKARELGIMDECCSHMELKKAPAGTWTKEKCFEESAKYIGTHEWQQKSPGSYNAARRLGIYVECCKAFNKKRPIFRTKEEIISLAKTFKNVREWKQNDKNSYTDAHSKGILPLCTSHMPKKGELKRKWTFDKVKDAVGNQTKSEFRKSNKSAYRRALANGWLDILFPLK